MEKKKKKIQQRTEMWDNKALSGPLNALSFYVHIAAFHKEFQVSISPPFKCSISISRDVSLTSLLFNEDQYNVSDIELSSHTFSQ